MRRRSRPSRAPSPGVAISLNSAPLTLFDVQLATWIRDGNVGPPEGPAKGSLDPFTMVCYICINERSYKRLTEGFPQNGYWFIRLLPPRFDREARAVRAWRGSPTQGGGGLPQRGELDTAGRVRRGRERGER